MKILTFCLYADMAASNTGKKIICLHSKTEVTLIKLIKEDLGATLVESIVAEIFNLNDISKLLSQHFGTVVFIIFEVL